MAYSTDVEAAKALATRTHEGQTDKAGLPYITHPERVAGRLDTQEEQVVGWLHDTVEDIASKLWSILSMHNGGLITFTSYSGNSSADRGDGTSDKAINQRISSTPDGAGSSSQGCNRYEPEQPAPQQYHNLSEDQ